MSHNWERPQQGHPACELWMSPDWAWTYVHYSLLPRLDLTEGSSHWAQQEPETKRSVIQVRTLCREAAEGSGEE